MTGPDLHAAITSRYHAYAEDFSAGDPDAAAAHWHAPSIAISPDGVVVYPTREARSERYAALAADLRETGYARSEPVEIRTHGLTPGTALSTIVWHRVTDEGTVLTRFSPLHLLRRTAGGWRFVARASRASADAMPMSAYGPTSGEAGAEAAAVRESVADFVEAYARDFSTADPTRAAAHWNAPTLLLSAERARVVESRAAAEAVLGSVFEGLREHEYARSEATAVGVRPLDDGIALADVRWERLGADGEAFDRFASLFVLRETDDGFRLVVISRHPVETMLPIATE